MPSSASYRAPRSGAGRAPGPNQVAVLPSLLQLNAQGANGQRLGRDLVRSTAVVNQNDVAGKVWFRLRPWLRFGPIREGGPE